jgi:hypothetical protein
MIAANQFFRSPGANPQRERAIPCRRAYSGDSWLGMTYSAIYLVAGRLL